LTPAQQKEYNSDYYKEHPEEKAGYLAKIDRENALTKDPLLTKTLDNLSSDLKPSERQTLMDQLAREGSLGLVAKANQQYIDVQNEYGIGSGFGRAAQALTGLASGIAGGNIGQGLSAAAAPYLAGEVGDYFDKLEVKNGKTDEITAARLLAHAAVGAAVAYASGNNATSGAIGGVSGEAMAMIVHKQLYDDKPVDQLTQAEKANIRATATLASGLVGGVAGGSFENAAVAAGAGYNAAVNNNLALQGLFVIRHPQIALAIGSVENPATVKNPNISTIASTFQLNLLGKGNGEGDSSNAFRHALWQALITKDFGTEIAQQAGSAHESIISPSSTTGRYSTLSQADEIVDQRNNEIGRYLASTTKSISNVSLARQLLEIQYTQGLYVAVPSVIGGYTVNRQTLSPEAYNRALNILNTLDRTGAGSSLQQIRNNLP
jgi:filamentous hemagglutinin